MKKRIRPNPAIAAAVLGLAALLVGCGQAGEILREAKSRSAAPADLYGTDAIARAAKDLEAKVGAPLRLLDLRAENGSVTFQYEIPGKAGEVDQYELRGGELLGPKPVQLMGAGELQENLYELAGTDLGCIPELSQKSIAALGFADAKVSSLRLRKEEPEDAARKRIARQPFALELHYVVYVDSPRSKGMIKADARCAIIKQVKF